MYAFRKPFSAAKFSGEEFEFFGLELKTTFVISQILGYAASKYMGIGFCSSAKRPQWNLFLIGLVVWAELCLLAFAVLPGSWGVIAMFLNGLSLGMVWGFVVRYLEGRQVSDMLLAALCTSFVVASGVTKDVGRWVMSAHGVTEHWMPFVTGLLFLPLFLLTAWLLDQIPDPTPEDQAHRTERLPMNNASRKAFVMQFLPGLILLFVTYFFLTAYRDYRDNYGVEILEDLGEGDRSAVFSRLEIPVGILVLASLALLYRIRDHRRGLRMIFLMMSGGMTLIGVGTLAFDAGMIGGLWWLFLTGLGTYLAYVPFNAVLFDRLIAWTRVTGTAVFAIYVADALGYTGSVGMQIYRDIFAPDTSRLDFFRVFTYALAIGGTASLGMAWVYFLRQRAAEK